jgi:hypothetical protein
MRKVLVMLLLIRFTMCLGQTQNLTDHFKSGQKLSELSAKNLKEISGLATSIANPKMLWAHNDKGNEPEVYLLDEKLNITLTCKLQGITNRDWEDIAVGPGPDPSRFYIYVGDIGDNDAVHEYKHVYRFVEPKLVPGQNVITVSRIDIITIQLSDAKKDMESIMIDPATRNLYLISKRENPTYVYEVKYPYATSGTVTAVKLFSIPFTEIVAADINPVTGDILLKNYEHVYFWKNSEKKSLLTLLKQPPLEVPYIPEPQGESITWARDGSGFYTLSEQKGKKKAYLYYYPLK